MDLQFDPEAPIIASAFLRAIKQVDLTTSAGFATH
jgi:hypothetical protein